MIVKRIQDVMYQRRIFLIYDFDQISFDKQFTHYMFKDDVNVLDQDELGTVFSGKYIEKHTHRKPNAWFIIINKHPLVRDVQYTLVHEIIHLAIGILDDLQFDISKDADEAIAWYYEYLYKQISQVFNKIYERN